MSSASSPFRLNGELLSGPVGRHLEPLLERAIGLRELEAAYRSVPRDLDLDGFLAACLSALRVEPVVGADELALVPASGGAVLVANHPGGAIDGIVLAAVLRRRRPDVRFFGNEAIARLPELAPLFIGGVSAGRRAAPSLREAVSWVEQGGLLVVFPAGEASQLQPRRGAVSDPAWRSAVARIVARTQAPVIPAYLAGRNRLGFQLAGLVHPWLRTALLPRELLNKQHYRLSLRFGHALRPEKLAGLAPRELVALLRLRVYSLAERRAAAAPAQPVAEPVAEAQPAAVLTAEVAALEPSALLAENGALAVYCTRAERIPRLLQEIGRLRELTFRATGEGTGRSRDIDLFDSYYLQLFIWNREQNELVGAYRLGEADRILARYGRKGLYTQSLFRFGRRLLDELGPALELGRSFIRPEYQRSYAPLLLLWKGIGAYVAANPRYRVLFGPVSISAEYETASRQLLVDFLSANNRLPELARLVKPRRRFKGLSRRQRVELTIPEDADQVSRLLEQLERDGKGMPVLLRQYLKLGGRVLGFNVDPAFANALDGLLMVDLCRTDPKVLGRYMGADGMQRFLAHHAESADPRAVA